MEVLAASVESLCNLLARSRLLQAHDVHTLHRRWRMEAKEAAGDRDAFARWLVANEYITDYQASILLRGFTENFFLGHYKILSRIGKGRMAGVYKAVHNLGTVVAIKVLPPSRARNPKIFARFQREGRMALRLRHPNVVRTFQLGNSDGLVYLVMEYLEGETLEDVLRRRAKLPVGEAVRLMHQALVGLQHIHEKGMVHRDLKPANFMLVRPAGGPTEDTTLNATLKILDIGLGRDLFDEHGEKDAEPLQLTSEGAVLGTPDYLAPEQARNAHTADIRADIYSLGCVLFRLLTGKPPFPEKNVFQQVLRHATDEIPPIRDLEPAVPAGLQQVIGRMAAREARQRYASPGQAAKALLEYLPGRQPPRPPDPAPEMRTYLRWVEQHQDEVGDSFDEAKPPAVLASVFQFEEGAVTELPALPRIPAVREPAAAGVPTKVMAAEDAEPFRPFQHSHGHHLGRRDYVVLAIGIWLGAAAVLLIEGIVWLLWHTRR